MESIIKDNKIMIKPMIIKPLHIITYHNPDRWVYSFCGNKLDVEYDNFIMINDIDNLPLMNNLTVCRECENKLQEYIGKDR